jgi:triphosphoribosyl-dephospho-CoA synthase
MVDSLNRWRRLSATPADAIRWACVLEATATKVGNVYPGRPFADLEHVDFVAAAEIASSDLTAEDKPMSQRMLSAVQRTASKVGSNVNLGIVLLLGPLVGADAIRNANDWQPAIEQFLQSLDEADGASIFSAISAASPGGLGDAESNDVRSTWEPVNIVAAMTQAADRDRVARQYATNFADLIENVTPVVNESISNSGSMLGGISRAHLRLLAEQPDSLIARKCGEEFALQVRDRAAEINIDDPEAVERFDQWLRKDGHRRNPGTTADLIAASLYLILRTNE